MVFLPLHQDPHPSPEHLIEMHVCGWVWRAFHRMKGADRAEGCAGRHCCFLSQAVDATERAFLRSVLCHKTKGRY
jgi:hypothetical protein